MNRQKLISVLQSRIAKRKRELKDFWLMYNLDKKFTKMNLDFSSFKRDAIELGVIQEQDKAILKQLILDGREIKDWKREFERSCETNRSLEVQIKHVKATGHPLVRGNAN